MNKIQITLNESTDNLMSFVGLDKETDNIREMIKKSVNEVMSSSDTVKREDGIEINQKDTVRAVLNNFSTEQTVLLASKMISKAVVEYAELEANPLASLLSKVFAEAQGE